MTAEIAILNREAIALAADSAVTFMVAEGEKIFPSANKIFELSEHQPVALMIYGNADFMGTPWETLIKVYRSKLQTRKFDLLSQYAEDFIQFLRLETKLYPENVQFIYLKRQILDQFLFIRSEIEDVIEEVLANRGKIAQAEIRKIVRQIITQQHLTWKEASLLEGAPPSFLENFEKKHQKLLEETIAEVFASLPVPKELQKKLTEIAGQIFIKFPEPMNSTFLTGLVVAGFGEEDLYPVLYHYLLEGVAENFLKYKLQESLSASNTFEVGAAIVPFAQIDTVHAFFSGIHPEYNFLVQNDLSDVFSKISLLLNKNLSQKKGGSQKTEKKNIQKELEQLLNDHQKRLEDYRLQRFIRPMLQVISTLPKAELASLAESLVNLTSLKKRISFDMETVGGPIDVVVLSKGDGFIWLKRKHYFSPQLNPRFMNRYQQPH